MFFRITGARGAQAFARAGAVALSLPARSVLSGTAQSLLLPLMIRAAYGSLGSEPDDACGDHQSDSSGNHGPFDRFRIRARWPHSTFLAAHRWILQDETPSPDDSHSRSPARRQSASGP